MERGFEKISFEEFKKSVKDDEKLYESIKLPIRKTSKSAGYDFIAFEDITIKPVEIKKIPTGYKVKLQDDEVLLIVVRSSMGFKYNIRLCNQVGVIDADYYNNESNEGHFYFQYFNFSDHDLEVKKGDVIGQVIFQKYLTIDNDQSEGTRKGGFGSTDK